MIETTVMKPVATCWEEAVEIELNFLARHADSFPDRDLDTELKLLFMFDLRPHFNLHKVTSEPAMERLLGHRMLPVGVQAVNCLQYMGIWDQEEMTRLLISKQKDYGHGNILSFGLFGVAVRMSDKLERLKNLLSKSTAPLNETLEDTVMDIVGYATIAAMLLEGTFELQLREDQ
jgi:hypothetical protein